MHTGRRASRSTALPFLCRVGLRDLAAVEGFAVRVVERGGQLLLLGPSQSAPHRRVRTVLLELLQGGEDDGHGLAVVPGGDAA
ncbi:hypothetical protein ACFVFJ_46240 [Streptomyces sp. NPDC057717]|uniref:hypothetical protein n=1 Tax=Streptomyces sp. NPDC057717 TaxID=3346224 RepID=UPI003691A088